MSGFPAVDLLGGRHPASALVRGEPALRDLLAHAPGDEAGLVAAGRAAAARDLDRASLSAALGARLASLDAPPGALAAAARLAEPGVVVVVTGQQPGLLGGPLMVLVKALAAAALARRLGALGVPAVPVFWHASEDHDLAEAESVGWPTRGGARRLRAPFAESPRMLSRAALPSTLGAVVAEALADLPDGPGRALLERLLPTGEADAVTFGTWTARLLARVLGAQGVVLVEPDTLRAAGAPVVRHEIRHPGALRATIARAEERLRGAGLASPLALRRPELFYVVDDETGVRRVARHVGSGDHDIDGVGRVPRDALLERLRCEPGGFSWNVAARVLAQDVALPVAAQVCGPAELAYVALLREAHDQLGVPQPAAWLRPGATLVGPRVRRACAALGVAEADVVREGASAFPEPPIENVGAFEALRRAVEGLPTGGSPAARRRRAEVQRNADLLAAALRAEAHARDTVGQRRRDLVLGSLAPFGRPAERSESFLPLFARSGDAGVARLLAALGNAAATHHVLSTEDL